ncbi:MAG: fumarylacetoacetate hydrolase family protein [Bacteroidetes bacterium]|nr:fumarylacetoacetate hydrolase family protein [Bacteroidota bacterium]MBS1943558.1 fumarylacetoacetate hydrolase family protein [Bacteroidota bacterium]
MKIICIGRNYADHARELGTEAPKEPIFFMKPTTACLYPGQPIILPDIPGEIEHELELVLMLDSYAKNVPVGMALGLVASYSLGLDLTARTLQNQLKAKGLPWEKAKAWDGSAVLGEVELPMTASTDLQSFAIELKKNGQTVQKDTTANMIFPVAELISYVSRFVTIEPGDLLFTGTPAGIGPIVGGDVLEGFLNGKRLLHATVAKG